MHKITLIISAARFFIRKYGKRRPFSSYSQIKSVHCYTFRWKMVGEHQTSGTIYSNSIFNMFLLVCVRVLFHLFALFALVNEIENITANSVCHDFDQ